MAAVKIVVKNVYKAGQAHEFLVSRGASVRELKALVAREFAENPAPADQKLIFGGKICNDDDVLDEVLAQQGQGADSTEDEDVVSVVFHLLVASKTAAVAVADAKLSNTHAASPADTAVNAEDAAVDSPRPSAAAAAQTPPSFSTPNLFAPPPVSATSTAVPPATPTAPTSAPSASQHELYRQMALMQQQAMILTQIQYLQQLQQQQQHASAAPIAHGAAGHAFAAPLVPPFMPFGNYFGGHLAHFPPPFAAAEAAAGVHAPAAPAAAAPVAPRGPPPMIVVMMREVLPLFEIRLALKMAFMLFLIGQDTPTDRVLMLGLLSFISYLHITGIFAKIYEVYQRHRNPNAAENGVGNQQAAAQGAAAPQAGGAGGLGGGVSRLLRISSDQGMVQDVKYFVTGLLLSLVPAWHPQPLAGGAAPVPQPENAMPEGAEIPLQGI